MIVNNKLEEINNKIEILEIKLDQQNEKLDLILNIINNDIKNNCNKMSEHIDFIQSVYDRVKSPMYYICDKFSNIPSISWT